MACDCLEKIHDDLMKQYGEVYFTNTVNVVQMSTGKDFIKPEPLRFKRSKILKDGTRSKSIMVSGFVTSHFCQFCGKQY